MKNFERDLGKTVDKMYNTLKINVYALLVDKGVSEELANDAQQLMSDAAIEVLPNLLKIMKSLHKRFERAEELTEKLNDSLSKANCALDEIFRTFR